MIKQLASSMTAKLEAYSSPICHRALLTRFVFELQTEITKARTATLVLQIPVLLVRTTVPQKAAL